jgi:hypothetical protein
MHYAIATLLERELGFQNDAFVLGNLAPDAHQLSGSELKKRSHFMKDDAEGISYVDHRAFYQKYLAVEKDPFHLGYYVHLVADSIWLGDVYFKKVKWLPAEIKQEVKKQYYRDFWRLNGKLIDHYPLELKELCGANYSGVDEISAEALVPLIGELEGDFKNAASVKTEPLEVLELEEVVRTIGKTVETCLPVLKKGMAV